MNKKNILITGWLWYIWSHWVVAFEEAWYNTVIVDNTTNSSIDTLLWIEKILWYKPDFFNVDLRDINNLEEVFKKYDFDWVIHFAWLKAPFESQNKAIYYFQNNIAWSLNLFELMDKYWVKNIVFSSSANTYSISNIPPISETDTQSTTNPYGTTKLLLEKILEDMSKFSNFNVINLRYFNPIWASSTWYLWENPNWIPNNLFPYIFKVLNWELPELKVFWWDYDTVDWSWVRDYIDVNDLVNAHLLAFKKLISLKDNNWYVNNYNVGVWRWYSVLEVINKVEETLWKKVTYRIVERRAWDIPISFCNTKKIEKELGFIPSISMHQSILNTWNFVKNFQWEK